MDNITNISYKYLEKVVTPTPYSSIIVGTRRFKPFAKGSYYASGTILRHRNVDGWRQRCALVLPPESAANVAMKQEPRRRRKKGQKWQIGSAAASDYSCGVDWAADCQLLTDNSHLSAENCPQKEKQ